MKIPSVVFAYLGNDNVVGWQALAPTIPPHLRGPLAYIFGRRYLHLKNLRSAQKFFETARKNAPDRSPLHRLASAELARLSKKSPTQSTATSE